jgi:hypothetical protein
MSLYTMGGWGRYNTRNQAGKIVPDGAENVLYPYAALIHTVI